MNSGKKNRSILVISFILILFCCLCLVGGVLAWIYGDALFGGFLSPGGIGSAPSSDTPGPAIGFSNIFNSNKGGRIYGEVIPNPSEANIRGTIKLLAEASRATKDGSQETQAPINQIEIKTGQLNFEFAGIAPGKYYLDVDLVLNPCFLGAPGSVFNGMQISFMKNWSPLGLSLKDGSSIITGATEVIDLTTNNSFEVRLQLPKCYPN
jgi:hypothetical protein